MPIKTIYRAEIQSLQILDECGNFDAELAKDTLSNEDVKSLMEQMIVCREFDEAAFKLQRSGRMGTFPQNKGEEAASIGAAHALRKGVDHLVPYYRENSAMFHHGMPMHQILMHWMGDERGNAIPASVAMSPISVEIGAQTLHATGIAWAFKLRREPRVVLCFFGDGATSTGDFHAAMNFASTLRLPIVFACINNGWAISVPTGKQTATESFAQKALAYGMPTIRVDGNDVFAVYKAHREAVDRARNGEGPSFVESVTYRIGDHTTADDSRRYRDAAQHEAACARDPLIRTRMYLQSVGLWDESIEAKATLAAKAIVEDVIRAATSVEKPSPRDMFDFMFAELPAELKRQRDTMRTDSIGQDPATPGLKPRRESEEPEPAHAG